VFIELTDHLRCPAEHAESFLVLLPDGMAGRRVASGSLGCPVCGRVVTVAAGNLDFGGDPPSPGETRLTADGVAALLGLQGPGGYLAILGGAGATVEAFAAALPGIRLVLVNPPGTVMDSDLGSVVRSARTPLKTSSMRGVVVSADHAGLRHWVDAAVDAVLPGNPVIVEGAPIERPDLAIVAQSPGLWVGRKIAGRA
jgi:hypothetical protein